MSDKLLSVTTIAPIEPKPVQPQPQRLESRYMFINELSRLAYAFGDERDPRSDTLELLECYMIEYIKDLLLKAQNRSYRRGQPKLEITDIMHYLREHPKQYHRVKQLQKQKILAKKNTSVIKKFIDEDNGKKKKKL